MTLSQLHLAILCVTALFILYADHVGLRYFLGKTPTIQLKSVKIIHYAVFIGLIGMIITGVFLTLPGWKYYVNEPAFQLKMFFVLMVFINGLFIGKLMHVATTTPYKKLTNKQKLPLIVSGGMSATGWGAAAIIGLFFL